MNEITEWVGRPKSLAKGICRAFLVVLGCFFLLLCAIVAGSALWHDSDLRLAAGVSLGVTVVYIFLLWVFDD